MAHQAVMRSMPISQVMISRKANQIVPATGKNDASLCAGFSLIELCVVILIMGLVAAIAFPQLAPLLIFSELDAESRRLAHYGAGVIAEASMFGTDVTVYIDLDNQEYYAVRLVYPEPSEGLEESIDQLGIFSDFRSSNDYSAADISEMLSAGSQGDQRLTSKLPEGFDPAEADTQMYDKFNARHRQLLYTRAQNVKQDESFLSEIGPLFESEFSLSWEEPQEEELADPILQRHKMPQGIWIDGVGGEGGMSSSGVAEIHVSPLGLSDQAVMYLRNEDGDYFTVLWNPLTGRGISQEGRLS